MGGRGREGGDAVDGTLTGQHRSVVSGSWLAVNAPYIENGFQLHLQQRLIR